MKGKENGKEWLGGHLSMGSSKDSVREINSQYINKKQASCIL